MLLALLLWLAATPSPDALLTTAIAKRDAQADKKFTYREDREQWEASKDGPLKRTRFETYDVIMLEGCTGLTPETVAGLKAALPRASITGP